MHQLALVAILSVSATPPPSTTVADRSVETGRKCPESRLRQAEGRHSAKVRRLDQLPPGSLELTVLREIDRCPIPAVLREGIGGNPADQDRPLRR